MEKIKIKKNNKRCVKFFFLKEEEEKLGLREGVRREGKEGRERKGERGGICVVRKEKKKTPATILTSF